MRVTWTDDMLQRAVAMRHRGLTYRVIAARLGLPHKSVETKLYITLTPGVEAKNKLAQRLYRQKEKRTRILPAEYPSIIVIPNETLANRDARLAALSRQNVTQRLMGDPPPGFSALEMRS
jgi:hypothetical protein